MNQCKLVGAASMLLVLLSFTPSIAWNQHPSFLPMTETSKNVEEAEVKKHKEEETRKEAEQNAQLEKQKHQDADAKEEDRKIKERKDQERENDARKEKEEARQNEENKAKEDARVKEEKRKEEEARLEAKKLKRVQRRQDHERRKDSTIYSYPSDNSIYYPSEHSTDESTVIVVTPQKSADITTIPTGTGTVAVPSTASLGTSSENASSKVNSYSGNGYYHADTNNLSHASLLYAPGSADRQPAVGLQYITNKNYGIGLWFSGDFGQDGDVIEASIPHDDYYTESKTGTYGVECLYAAGSDRAALIIGVGVSVEKTTYTDISNATGWKWDGGDSSSVKPSAQIGCRFKVGGRASLQIGYDSAQASYFGFSAAF